MYSKFIPFFPHYSKFFQWNGWVSTKMPGLHLFHFIPNHSLKVWSKARTKVFHFWFGQCVQEFDDIINKNNTKISLHQQLLSIDTMKFESLAFAHLLNSNIGNEVFAFTVQIETLLLLKMFVMYFQHQINKIRYLNCQQDPRHQPHMKWRKILFNHLGLYLEQLSQAQPSVGERVFSNVPHFSW